MCGIAGFLSNSKADYDSEKVVKNMTFTIRHRGPDSMGIYSDEKLSIGFSRLMIIDPEQGDQPMTDESGRYVIAFNGEIYNYEALRKKLSSDYGISFKTNSDTESLLYACICYGKDVMRHLRGMYAFVFYDREKSSIFCARDPFGIKPFYYGIFDNTLIFSSEIKAFYAHPSFKADFDTSILPLYLQFQYVPTENTAFKGVNRLLPGHCLKYRDGNLTVQKFFDLPTSKNGKFRSYSFGDSAVSEQKPVTHIKEAAKNIESALRDSVKIHLKSDFEVGAFLSGGVDSAYVTALAKPAKAFTVTFNGSELDEQKEAEENAKKLGIKLIERNITSSEFFKVLPQVQYHSDEPYANLSAVPLYLLAEKASGYVKVILSGEGADELFAGYDLYNPGIYGRIYSKFPKKIRVKGKNLRFLGKRVHDFATRNSQITEDSFIGQAKIMSSEMAYSLLSENCKSLRSSAEITYPHFKSVKDASDLQKMLYLDRNLWMPFDILNKADKMTMAHSLELRVPYLDLKVLGVAQTMSDRLLIKGNNSKYTLRVSASRIIGKESAFRKKKGFPVPFRDWIKQSEYSSALNNAFESETCKKFFDSNVLKHLLNAHISGIQNNARILYTVYSFIIWYDIYFGKDRPKFLILDKNDSLESKEYEKETDGKR